MRRGTRAISMALAILLSASVFLAGCGNQAPDSDDSQTAYTDFREIPGVTDDEISAIEKLRGEVDGFVYGMSQTSEAFLGPDGKVGGFAALFCEWLGGMFGIQFTPQVMEWEALMAGLGDGSVDFTGELTVTEQRLESYYTTNSIAERTIKYFRLKGAQSLDDITRSRNLRIAFMQGSVTQEQVRGSIGTLFDAVEAQSYD